MSNFATTLPAKEDFQMKKDIRQKLNSKKRKIERRLAKAAQSKDNGPMLSGSNIHYEISEKVNGIAHGGIGAIHKMVKELGLDRMINERLHVFIRRQPYHESDHVFNLAYNLLCNGHVLEDIELRRNDEAFLDALGTKSLPDPTTAGDFCRRFTPKDINQLMDIFNETRMKVWKQQPASFTHETARIDADGTFVPTTGECKEGMGMFYKGGWGYHVLVMSLANTGEPLFLLNRSGNRPSHEGAVEYYDKAVMLCRKAGFKDILLRGDTDFSLTDQFDRWTDDGVRFAFGYNAYANLKEWAHFAPPELYEEFVKKAEHALKTKPRQRPENIKKKIVRERGYTNIRTESEEVVDFEYQPRKCKRPYRIVALRKNLSIEKGENVLFPDVRYFFFVTNDWKLTPQQVVQECHNRCNQENLNQQLKTGMRALRAPLDTLNANWAYMVMASLAWSLKAWVGLLLPVAPRWKDRHEEEKRRIIRMDFRTFLAAFINVPAQIIRTGRKIVYRFLSWNRWQPVFFRFLDGL